jgi:hypothetical protein
MTDAQQKMQFLKFSRGKWKAAGKTNKNEPITVEITIGDELTTVKQEVTTATGIEKTEDRFETNDAWWLEQFYQFLGNRKYFLTSADEKYLRFGELVNPVVFDGNYRWFLKFERVGVLKDFI